MASNYPEGVTGDEHRISGDTYVDLDVVCSLPGPGKHRCPFEGVVSAHVTGMSQGEMLEWTCPTCGRTETEHYS